MPGRPNRRDPHPLDLLRKVFTRARPPRDAASHSRRSEVVGQRPESRYSDVARDMEGVDDEANVGPSTPVVTVKDVASVPDGPRHLITYVMWTFPCDAPGVQENGLFTVSNN